MLDAYYECQQSIEMARLGYLFANGKLTQDDAETVIYNCQPIAGWFPIETFSVAEVMKMAAARWANAEDVRSLAESACRRICDRISGEGETSNEVTDYAIDLVQEWAAASGVKLVELDSEEATE